MEEVPGSAPRPSTPSSAGPQALVYVRDSESEGVIHQVLSDLGVTNAVFKSDGARAAIADTSERASPRLLIVDISDVDDPVATATELLSRCEPSTGVVLIGNSNDIRLYRTLKEAGVTEYFFKPLVVALMSRTCSAILSGEHHADQAAGASSARSGRLILVLGARGGVGATTLAVRTAMRLSTSPPRPVVLVDLDLQFGDASLQLEVTPNHALREALERADRVDDLFLERGVIHITKRLDLLASLEPPEEAISYDEDSLLLLLNILRQRYRYVVVDLESLGAVSFQRVLHLPSLLLLVSDGGLASARDVARIRELLGPNTPERTTMHILNKNGAPGSLPAKEFARGAGQEPDVIIPWSREIATASNLGVKIRPECPTLDHALAPVFARVAGERVQPGRSPFSKLFG